MAKGTMLDRLAEAMGTLNKRPRKGLTPRQRVANAQRWNSLANIGESYVDNFPSDAAWRLSDDEAERWHDAIMDAKQIGILEGPSMYDYNRAPNPFLSKIPAKYDEQSGFLAWCRDNRIPPTPASLKQFRWETYKTLPYRQRQWIANKDAVKSYLGPEMYGYDKRELDRINTLDELEDYLQEAHPEDNWPRRYPMQDSPVFESLEEFPDDFDYMWRY